MTAGERHSGDAAALPVAYRSILPWLLTERRNVSVARPPTFIADIIDRLRALITTAGGPASNPVLDIYRGRINDDSDGPVEIVLTVAPIRPSRSTDHQPGSTAASTPTAKPSHP